MGRLADKAPIYLELYEALAYFRSRQQLVLRFVTDQGVSVADFSRGVRAWREKTTQKGEWGDDWTFFFHGGGCMLRHKTTGENIDFNGSDPESIGIYSFEVHLQWRLANETGLSLLRAYVEEHSLRAIDILVEDLISDGIITPDHHLMIINEPQLPASA